MPPSDPAAVKAPAKLSASPMPHSDPAAGRIMPQAPQPIPAPQGRICNFLPCLKTVTDSLVHHL